MEGARKSQHPKAEIEQSLGLWITKRLLVLLWARKDSNLRPNGYASRYSFRCPFQVCGLDYPFTPFQGRLPSSLYTFPMDGAWLGITLSCDVGFPEFGKIHLEIAFQAALCDESY